MIYHGDLTSSSLRNNEILFYHRIQRFDDTGLFSVSNTILSCKLSCHFLAFQTLLVNTNDLSFLTHRIVLLSLFLSLSPPSLLIQVLSLCGFFCIISACMFILFLKIFSWKDYRQVGQEQRDRKRKISFMTTSCLRLQPPTVFCPFLTYAGERKCQF